MSSEELQASLKSPIGQIESGLRCMQHPDLILSGRHRSKILNTVGKKAQFKEFDCDALAKKLNISHNLAHWLVISTANIRREITKEERAQDFLQMAIVMEKDGLAPEKRPSKIAELTGLSLDWVEKLLPKEHKRAQSSPTQSDSNQKATELPIEAVDRANGAEGEPSTSDESQSMKQSSDKGRFGPDASKYKVSTYTQAEQLFASQLSYFNIEYRTQEVFTRPGEFTNGGTQKIFAADFYLPKQNLVIEVMGEGSSSDSPGRDAYFKEKEIKVVKFPNYAITKFGAEIAQLIAVLTKGV